MGNKRKYFSKNSQASNKKSKYMFDEKVKLGPNMKGYLITYNSPSEQDKSTENKNSNDIEKQLQEELDSLNTMDKELSILDTGAKYTIFINQPNVDPNHVVGSIFGHIDKSEKPLGRFVQRFLPILNTCKSYLDDLDKCLKSTLDDLEVIKSSVEGPDAKSFKYCCVFKTSNNNVLSRDEVFKLVGGYMQSKNKQNKVDFDNPDYVVIINVICNLCFVSFVGNYFQYRKYNLIEMGTKFNKKNDKQELKKTEPDDIKNAQVNDEESDKKNANDENESGSDHAENEIDNKNTVKSGEENGTNI
ncbi:unnamed protein product [Brachionus calyciflorus]|uniref:THUMP domain-containing protein n=1 Tax=Brachionus calyciflorus TaxID=104777 RepID=A0A813N346_9BILA|nr:unnamed protein product [Brachionus calyciflorus]